MFPYRMTLWLTRLSQTDTGSFQKTGEGTVVHDGGRWKFRWCVSCRVKEIPRRYFTVVVEGVLILLGVISENGTEGRVLCQVRGGEDED